MRMWRIQPWHVFVAVLFFSVGCSQPVSPTPTPEVATAVPSSPTETVEQAADPELEPTDEPIVSDGRFPYEDSQLPIEERIDDLLGRMSLDEKIGQMTLVEKDSISPQDVTRYHIGAILSGGGGAPPDNTGAGWLEMVTGFQEAALDTDLQIPLLYGVDAVHGHNNVPGATIFPHNIGLGATRNPDLIEAIGRATAVETIATGIHWDYAPVLAVPRDIRWGRAYEGYGENTELVSELATAFLIGLQGTDGATDLPHPETVLGTPKHFVGDGGAVWGSSTTGSYFIDQGVTDIDEAALREIHLPPYYPAIEAGALSMMASYSSWGGMKMHAQAYLLTDVLKEEMGFEGFIVSDWKAIDQIDDDFYTAVVISINAGIDMNMVPYDYRRFIRVMNDAVDDGDISEARIDDAVRRILRAKFALGLFEAPYGDETLLAEIGSDAHRELARQSVRESLVLLQNRDGVLPLSPDSDRIFVSGVAADNVGIQSGGWTIDWQGFSGNDRTPGTSILAAIQDAVGDETEVVFDRFGKFEQEADEDGSPLRADVGIVVLGERPYAEGRGDSDDLGLNTVQVARMAERADHVVVIVLSGRPLIITDALPLADAWVAAWLPGTEGNGVTDVLFGDYPFTGKLSYTWPRSVEQLPFDFDDLAVDGCESPLFMYGYGLTTEDTTAVEPLVCP